MSVKRFSEGMQFTIYIVPGAEQKHQELLEEIETLLINERIRPGIIYPTDRALGRFCSIRHPGTIYQNALSVNNYNPDNLEDPFKCLPSYSLKAVEHDHIKLNNKMVQSSLFKILSKLNHTISSTINMPMINPMNNQIYPKNNQIYLKDTPENKETEESTTTFQPN